MSNPGHTHDTKKPHCSDVKYEPGGQLTFTVGCDEGVRSAEEAFKENTAHFLSPYQSSDMQRSIEVTDVHNQQGMRQGQAPERRSKLASYFDKERGRAQS